jgi:hypothetical protein
MLDPVHIRAEVITKALRVRLAGEALHGTPYLAPSS